MHRGYIKVWRKVEDSFINLDSETFHLWITLLLLANHKENEFMFNGSKMVCKQGQFISGRKTLSDRTGISESKIYRLLNIFELEHLIEQQKTNLFSIISIVNYSQYQSNEQQVEQPMNNQRTTSEQPVNTNNTLIRTKKNEKEVYTPEFEAFWLKYPKAVGKKEAYRHYRATVQTEADRGDLETALKNYISSKRVKDGFIQDGSTWMNNWKDFVNYTDPVPLGEYKSEAYRKMEESLNDKKRA